MTCMHTTHVCHFSAKRICPKRSMFCNLYCFNMQCIYIKLYKIFKWNDTTSSDSNYLKIMDSEWLVFYLYTFPSCSRIYKYKFPNHFSYKIFLRTPPVIYKNASGDVYTCIGNLLIYCNVRTYIFVTIHQYHKINFTILMEKNLSVLNSIKIFKKYFVLIFL